MNRLLRLLRAADGSDRDLLARYARDRDEDAFAGLVRRYGAGVWAACARLAGPDAADAFQAVFLALDRKAGTVDGALPAWLHAVARRVAANLRRAARRRRAAEAAAARPETTAPPAPAADPAVLDEELARLPERYRTVLIVCCLEGRSRDEAAAHLGWTGNQVKGRLERGRDLLRRRLGRRGVEVGALLLAAAAAGPAPALTHPPSPVVVALTHGVLRAMAMQRLKLTAAALAVVGAVTLAAGAAGAWAVAEPPAGGPRQPPGRAVAPPEPAPWPASFGANLTRGRDLPGEYLELSGPNAERYVRRDEKGLRVTLPARDGPAAPVGVAFRYPVRGDFVFDAAFELLDVAEPPTTLAAGVNVYVAVASPAKDGLWLGKMRDPELGPVFHTGVRGVLPTGERGTKNELKLNAGPLAGVSRVRLVRRGGTFQAWAGEGREGALKPLGVVELGTADVTLFRLAAEPGMRPDTVVDARLLEYRLAAREFVGHRPRDHAAAPGRVPGPAGFTGAAVVVWLKDAKEGVRLEGPEVRTAGDRAFLVGREPGGTRRQWLPLADVARVEEFADLQELGRRYPPGRPPAKE